MPASRLTAAVRVKKEVVVAAACAQLFICLCAAATARLTATGARHYVSALISLKEENVAVLFDSWTE